MAAERPKVACFVVNYTCLLEGKIPCELHIATFVVYDSG